MFKFLKDKLKKAVNKFSKDVDEETEEIEAVEKDQQEESVVEDEFEDEKEESESDEEVEPEQEVKEEADVDEFEPESKDEKEEPELVVEEEHTPAEFEPDDEPKKKGFLGRLFHREKKEEQVKSDEEVEPEEEVKEKADVDESELEKEGEEELESEKPVEEVKEEVEFEPVEEEKEEEFEPEQDESKQAVEKVKEELVKEEKRGFFVKLKDTVTKKAISEEKFEELFWELELVLLESNVAVGVIEKIKEDLRVELVEQKVLRGQISDIISNTLTKSIEDLFIEPELDILEESGKKKPYIILFLGVNGSGKTTNLAKLANYLKTNGKSVVIAACDTFRAAAIQQIEEHATNLDIKLIKHEYGSDAAAVAFDAISHAESKGKDIVLIDTAGRSHSNVNLMDELKKVVRVSNPDLKIFVGDSLTGNDAVEQAQSFDDAVGIDGVILSKMDVDEKGGASVSISYVTKKPIYFIGTGQRYEDLEPFNKKTVLKNLGL